MIEGPIATPNITVIPFHEAYQGLVRTFNSSIGAKPDARLRIKLIQEEAQEFLDAVEENKVIETIDALCDLLYVIYGAADSLKLGYLDTREAERSVAPGREPEWSLLHKSLVGFVKKVDICAAKLSRLAVPIFEEWKPEIQDQLKKEAKESLRELADACWRIGAEEVGVDLRPFFREVHRTNMHKLNGPIREDGKKLKPPGWKPPRIEAMYNRLKVGNPAWCSVLGPHNNDHAFDKSNVLPHPQGGYYCGFCGGMFLDVGTDLRTSTDGNE